MLKKAIPLFLLSGLVLGACNNDGALPANNETPMENMEDRERNWTPEVRDGRQGGMDLDGIDNNGNMNDNGVIQDNNGVRKGMTNDGVNTPNDPIIDGNVPNDVTTEDNRNRTNNNLNNR